MSQDETKSEIVCPLCGRASDSAADLEIARLAEREEHFRAALETLLRLLMLRLRDADPIRDSLFTVRPDLKKTTYAEMTSAEDGLVWAMESLARLGDSSTDMLGRIRDYWFEEVKKLKAEIARLRGLLSENKP